MSPKKRASGRHAQGSRTAAAGNPQPSGWAKYNDKLLKRQLARAHAGLEKKGRGRLLGHQTATELSREKMRKNAQAIAAVGVENLLDIGDEVSEICTSEKAVQQTSVKNQLAEKDEFEAKQEQLEHMGMRKLS